MTSNYLVYLIALPLLGSALLLFAGRKADKWGHLLGTAMSGGAFVIGLYEFSQMLGRSTEQRAVTQKLFSWISVGSFQVDAGLMLDQLSICFVLLITGVGTLIHIYSIAYMSHDLDRRRFFAYLNLFIAAMLLLVLGDSYLNLYVGWEGVGLASYLLIGFWNQKPTYATAAKKAFVANRVGDMGLSLAIMIAFATLGTVSFAGVKEQASQASTGALTAIGIMLLVAATGKSAQFPLQAWLGDAMAGPTPVSALIHAATMVTAGVYLITRSNFIFDAAPTAQLCVAIIGAITLLFGAIIGTAKDDIKKALAASTMSQIGYMVLGAGLGPAGYAFAIMHLLTHGFFKAGMFLGAGSVMHGMDDEVNMRRYGGLSKLNKKYFFEIIKDMRFERTMHFLLIFILGIVIARKILFSSFVYNTASFWGGIFSLASIIFAWLFSVVSNNMADIKIDTISNPNRPSVSRAIPIGKYKLISSLLLYLSLFTSLIVSWKLLFIISIFIGSYYLYSMPPFRFKRIPLFSKLFIGFNTLIILIFGYEYYSLFSLAIAEPHTINLFLVNFPASLYAIFLIGFSLCSNFIDLKDFEGDKFAGIITLPGLLGIKLAKIIIGLLFLLLYLLLYFEVPELPYFIPLSMIGLFQAYAFLRSKFNEKLIFYSYLLSLIIVIIYFYNGKTF